MIVRSGLWSPQSYAKIAGWLYLCTILGGLFAEFYVAGKLIVYGNPAATAANILGSETLFRTGIIAEVLGVAAYAGVSLLLYVLLKPAGKIIAMASVIFAAAGNILWLVGSLYQFAAIRLLHGGPALGAFNAAQIQALALQSLRSHDTALNLGMLFFGIYCLLIGILLFRSEYFPRTLGVLFMLGGTLDFLTQVIAFVSPALSSALPDLLQLPAFIAELSLTGWLIIVGINTARRNEVQHIEG